MPTYTGTSGADSFTAPDSQDWTINGLGGADILTGGAGNDVISGGNGNDVMDGGDGNDSFLFGPNGGQSNVVVGDSTITGGIGYDIVSATADNVVIGLAAISGVEEISAGGHVGVSISGDASGNYFDFSNVLLTGIGLISGGGGIDTIIGNLNTANSIDGGAGDDTLVGGNGDDIFYVGKNSGFDSFSGGAGFDTITAAVDGIKIGLGAISGIEAITAAPAFFSVQVVGTANGELMDFSKMTLTNIANIDGGDGNDTMIGTLGNDRLSGGAGDDVVTGGAGDDFLDGGKGYDILNGGNGNDGFYVSGGGDVYKGGAGYDTIYAQQNGANLLVDTGLLSGIEEISADGWVGMTISAANAAGSRIDLRHIYITDDDIAGIYGGNGDDTIFGSLTYDYIYGGLGNDTINGYLGDDEIHGGGGADTLTGGNGYDIVYGDAGNDVIDGGAQDDVLYGGSGDDVFLYGAAGGYDQFHGDLGIDTIQANNVGNINMTGFDGIEAISWDGVHALKLNGSFGDDIFDFSTVALTGVVGIFMGDGNDNVTGSVGNDVIDGEKGNDILIGGAGDDVLTGNLGTDTLTGGAGRDLFKDTAANLNGDSIADFAFGDGIYIRNAKDYTKVALTYTDDGTGLGGMLHIGGGGGLKTGIDIHLDGSFTTADFQVFGDGGTGAVIQFVGDTPLI